ncbi:MAG: hypothetical protein JW881_12415 [Spirochaetales bacterium]|nr:hypothetical protein [Spirochaetales bacterium]
MSKETEPHHEERLVIRPDVPQEVVYHYNREERLGSLDPDRAEKKKKRGGRNFFTVILVADILIIVIVLFFLRWSGLTDRPEIRMLGRHMRLGAYWIKDRVFVKLEIEGNGKHEDAPDGGECRVRFYQKEGGACTKTFVLPARGGGVKEISCSFFSKSVQKRIWADVSIGNLSERLSITPNER